MAWLLSLSESFSTYSDSCTCSVSQSFGQVLKGKTALACPQHCPWHWENSTEESMPNNDCTIQGLTTTTFDHDNEHTCPRTPPMSKTSCVLLISEFSSKTHVRSHDAIESMRELVPSWWLRRTIHGSSRPLTAQLMNSAERMHHHRTRTTYCGIRTCVCTMILYPFLLSGTVC